MTDDHEHDMHTLRRTATFRFYEELNDVLPREKRKRDCSYSFYGNPTVKDAIEAQGIPHTEVDLILVNGKSVDFTYHITNNDRISVYPVFESLDISELSNLRPMPLRITKFILDVHLGKLARYLRLLGFDTLYENDLDDHSIVRIASDEERIILTRDSGLLKHRVVTRGYLIRSTNPRRQAVEVVQRFDLVSLVRPFTRCMVCNGQVQEIEKEKILYSIERDTAEHHQRFTHCKTCGRIYWKGTHHARLCMLIDNIVAQASR